MLRRRGWTCAGAMHATVFMAVLVACLFVVVLLMPLAGEAQPLPSVPP
jgi:hypothetical protein